MFLPGEAWEQGKRHSSQPVLCKEIVKKYGRSMFVQSSLGKGTVVTISIPQGEVT